ncbi:T9SS type A sorting domain-containing protein [Niastella caeni]|uniref:T9SS type A sorting domain-containing protein n=1 Tax=Niastella caeni TaxID=2569763 RepID=A0A4S8HVH0_9BACT|nr:T9SS type A sorting domain-containing protein [Niastella caeni]THU39678.1 T9SS type A sorting domain-containing protein [Niastella caeni]
MKTNQNSFIRLKKCFRYLGVGALLLSGSQMMAQQLAFPTAQGFGRFATGGRGGKVYAVTNLSDSGAGSFREALSSFPGEPLTIVFKVGGTINLLSKLHIKRSDLTIAGQTAPGGGICLVGHSFILNGARAVSLGGNHGNVIIRYIRSRPGSTLSTGVYGFDMENCHDVMIDHCSFSWANEECAAMYDTKNVTVQWSIFSEGLYNAGHAKGVRGYGGVWGGQNASYHHNLIAHQNSRAIRFGGARAHDTMALVDYRNNVIYNSGGAGAAYGGEIEIAGGISQINMVNNYYKPGPASSSLNFVQASYNAIGIGKWYVDGNYMNGNSGKTSNNWTGVDLSKIPTAQQPATKSTVPFSLAGADIATQTAQAAYSDVLLNAGATLPVRDAVDVRIVNETTNGTAPVRGATSGKFGIIDSPSEVGGWPAYDAGTAPTDTDNDGMPDAWETANGTDPAIADNNSDPDADGYTNLEEYLNFLTGENSGSAIGPIITIQENATGFCSVNGTVDNNNAGYTGSGFANVDDGVGLGVTWNVNIPVTGTYVLTWRYANGGGVNRPGKLLINDAEVLSGIDFPATAGWTTWTDVSISQSFTAGQNTIRLESTVDSGLSNIDYLKVSGNNPTEVSCSGTARTTTGGQSLSVEGSARSLKSVSSVYPNPTTGMFTVSSVGKFDYIIFDQQGKQVEKGTAENKTKVGSALKAGIYFLKVVKSGNPEILKIVKQ